MLQGHEHPTQMLHDTCMEPSWQAPCLQGVVEDLAHEDELLGGALQARLNLLELIHDRHHQLRARTRCQASA